MFITKIHYSESRGDKAGGASRCINRPMTTMRGVAVKWLLFTILLGTWSLGWGFDEQSVNPGINREYDQADPLFWQGMFEQERREVYARRHDIVAELGLKPGMQVADVGAGTGFFSLLFAPGVMPGGSVYAVDIVPNFVRAIEARARAAGLHQIIGVVNDPKDVKLPKGAIDLVFITDTYHHFEYPYSMLYSIRRALKPQGRLVIIDYKKDPDHSSPWVQRHVRSSESQVIEEVESAGFVLNTRHSLLDSQFFLEFVIAQNQN